MNWRKKSIWNLSHVKRTVKYFIPVLCVYGIIPLVYVVRALTQHIFNNIKQLHLSEYCVIFIRRANLSSSSSSSAIFSVDCLLWFHLFICRFRRFISIMFPIATICKMRRKNIVCTEICLYVQYFETATLLLLQGIGTGPSADRQTPMRGTNHNLVNRFSPRICFPNSALIPLHEWWMAKLKSKEQKEPTQNTNCCSIELRRFLHYLNTK